MRRAGRQEEETDHTNQSTFGWKAATRKTATGSMQSDTAMDVTTVNLRNFTTNTALTNPTLTQISEQTRTVQLDGPGAGMGGALALALDAKKDDDAAGQTRSRPQRSIAWITPEKLQRADSRDEDK